MDETQVTITAKSMEITGTVQIDVRKEPGPGERPVTQNTKTINWSGEIPVGKWMVFYNKVLSKHVTKKGFKVSVSFEFESEGSGNNSTMEELKSELTELGLNSKMEK